MEVLQFDKRFVIKTPIFSRQRFNVFQRHGVLEASYQLSFTSASYALIFSDNFVTLQWKLVYIHCTERR